MDNKPITVRLPNELRVLFNQFVSANFHASENAAIVAIVQRVLTKPETAVAPVVVQQSAAPVMQSAEVAELKAELEKVKSLAARAMKMAEGVMSGVMMEADFNAHRHAEDGSVVIPDGEEGTEPTKVAQMGAVIERGGIVQPPDAVSQLPARLLEPEEEKEARAAKVAEIHALGEKEEAERLAKRREASDRVIVAGVMEDLTQLKTDADWAGFWAVQDRLGMERTAKPETVASSVSEALPGAGIG